MNQSHSSGNPWLVLDTATAASGIGWLAVTASVALVASVANANLLAAVVGLSAAALLCFTRISWQVLMFGAAVFCLGVVRARATEQRYVGALTSLSDSFKHPVRCEIVAQVQSQPQWRGTSLSFTAYVSSADCPDVQLPVGTRVRLYGGPEDLSRGDVFSATAELSVVQLFRNHDVLSPTWQAARSGAVLSGGVLRLDRGPRASGLLAGVDRYRAWVRRRIEATYVPLAVPLAKALVLGENDLTAEDDGAFKLSGLSHLLAVSGTHLVIAVGTLVSAIRALLLRLAFVSARIDVRRLAALAGIPIALLYADFAGGSGSALRAAWMLAAVYAAQLLGRSASAVTALAVSIVIAAVYDPLVGFDVSFMLSLGATLGLLRLGPLFQVPVGRVSHNGLRLFLSGIAATLAAMLPCSAVLALLSSEVSPVGILANAVAGPFGETIALPLCLVHAVVGLIPALEKGLALVGSGALLVVRRIALASAAHRFAPVPLCLPTAWHYVVLGLAVTLWLAGRAADADGKRRWQARASAALLFVLLLGVEGWCRRAGKPMGELRVTVLDVGQGDSALVDLPDGSLMLIDGGGFVGSPVDPGERVLIPVLRARRRDRIDVVVLSHPHPDHFGGLQTVLGHVAVGEFWDTGQGERSGAGPAYARLLATVRERGIPIKRPGDLCGIRQLGGATVEVLAPCPEPLEGRSANDNSLVFRVGFGRRAALFVGDAEAAEELDLLALPGTHLHADLLKVGHHGSRTSSSERFLAAVSPLFATISCGARNHFGHPHPEALQRLAAVPNLWRTDVSGSVTWSSDGEGCGFCSNGLAGPSLVQP